MTTATISGRINRSSNTADAIYVGTGSDLQNFFRPGSWYVRVDGMPVRTLFPNLHADALQVTDPADAVRLYREWLAADTAAADRIRSTLSGWMGTLSCRCEVGAPCHADALVEFTGEVVTAGQLQDAAEWDPESAREITVILADGLEARLCSVYRINSQTWVSVAWQDPNGQTVVRHLADATYRIRYED